VYFHVRDNDNRYLTTAQSTIDTGAACNEMTEQTTYSCQTDTFSRRTHRVLWNRLSDAPPGVRLPNKISILALAAGMPYDGHKHFVV
jgi:hypothetical protein